MSKYPKSPGETVKGMAYFARMLDKIRLHARGELAEEYFKNLGAPRAADGACCNFLRVRYDDLKKRVLEGGNDEEILQWCFDTGRELNAGDLVVWNSFTSKLGWNDFASERLVEQKEKAGVAHREDIRTVGDLIDFEEGRRE